MKEKLNSKSITRSWKSIAFLALLAAAPFCRAEAEGPTTCYRILQPQSNLSPVPTMPREEIWCYQHLSYPIGSLFIYNADNEEARPEMALVLSADGMITHGSLAAGKVTVHRVSAKHFNPYSIPLSEPRDSPLASPQEVHVSPESLQKVLSLLTRPTSMRMELQSMAPGRLVASVPPEHLPWRGYWWAYLGLPLSGSANSPLAKYDRFVQAHSGKNPGAADWENNHHYFEGTFWSGHCNGWAASSILRKEPRTEKRDPASGTVFTVADQKGILAERDYCAMSAFFGHRYNGDPGDNLYEVNPTDFHRALTYYIGQLGKPVAIDYRRDEPVQNNIISGYQMDVVRTGDNTFSVTAVLTIHTYDDSRHYPPGVAPSYQKTYRYNLTQDSSGKLILGDWLTENPDFLWVPLSSPKCNQQNPQIDESWTQQILSLPPST